MKIDFDEVSPVQRKIRIELPADKVASEFSRAYRDLGRRVRVKGFRAGKTPRSVLQGIYGDEIKGQVRSQLVEHSLGEVIRERGLQIVSRPEIDAAELEEGREFTFSAVFEIKPEIEPRDYLAIELEAVKLSVADQQIEQAIRRLQESHARLEPVADRDTVEKGDFVSLDFTGLIGDKPFPGSKGENYSIQVGTGQVLPQFDDALPGIKLGESRNIEVTYPQAYPSRELAGRTAEFIVVARDIKKKVLPPVDDEFAKDYGDCSSLAELREIVRDRLAAELKQIQREELKEAILNRLIENHSFTPPPAMVERQTRYLLERNPVSAGSEGEAQAAPTSEETRKSLEGRAVRQVKATLLIERISELEKVEVEDHQIQERIDNMVRAAGDRAKAVREFYSRADAREDLRAQMIFERTLNFLLERARIKEVDPPETKVDDQGKKS